MCRSAMVLTFRLRLELCSVRSEWPGSQFVSSRQFWTCGAAWAWGLVFPGAMGGGLRDGWCCPAPYWRMGWPGLIRSDVWTGLVRCMARPGRGWKGQLGGLLHHVQRRLHACLNWPASAFTAPRLPQVSQIAWISMDSVFLGKITSAHLLLLIGPPVRAWNWNRKSTRPSYLAAAEIG